MIYVVEDDKSIRELVAYALGSAGYETEGFTSGAEFFAALDAARARLVLLEIMLPGEDGLAILRRLRETPETAGIPVMIMSALGTELDKVRGLDLGADDYIAKPFGIMEFLARVRALLRRGEPKESLCIRGVLLYPAGRRVEAEGSPYALKGRPMGTPRWAGRLIRLFCYGSAFAEKLRPRSWSPYRKNPPPSVGPP